MSDQLSVPYTRPTGSLVPGTQGPFDWRSNYVRTTDGTVVSEGQVTNETWAARLWRWPTKWLPEAIVSRPALAVVVIATPFAFWGILAWFLFRRFKR